jgi:hypothetical protein
VAETTSGSRLSVVSLILVPSLITLAITILRLIGELNHWSKLFFNPSAGGGFAIVGISWLPFIFGPYFAVKIAGAGEGPKSKGKAIGYAILGLVLLFTGVMVAFAPQHKFPGKGIVGFVLMAAGAVVVLPGWPAFFKALLAYAYAARIPVLIVMFFAIRGNWGTHYDALPPGYTGPMDFWGKFVEIARWFQMIFWVVYTVTVGALLGTIFVALTRRGKRAEEIKA